MLNEDFDSSETYDVKSTNAAKAIEKHQLKIR